MLVQWRECLGHFVRVAEEERTHPLLPSKLHVPFLLIGRISRESLTEISINDYSARILLASDEPPAAIRPRFPHKMNDSAENGESEMSHVAKRLTPEEVDRMRAQDSRLVSEFRAIQLERNAKKHWDLFYKRNDTRFFKDRHWTTREFRELSGMAGNNGRNALLEVGCGVGNFVYPLMEDGLRFRKIFACDLSTRAIELLKVYKNADRTPRIPTRLGDALRNRPLVIPLSNDR